MLRRLLMIVALLMANTANAADGPKPLASAISALQAGRWENAERLAKRAGPAAETLIEWYRLRAGSGTPDQIEQFLARHGDWPGLALLRRRSEPAFIEATDAQVLSFFKDSHPRTGAGVLRHAVAQNRAGQKTEAQAGLARAWRNMEFGPQTQALFLSAHGNLLTPHHWARTEMLLWNGKREAAEAMLPLLSSDQQKLANARLAVQGNRRGLDAMIGVLPDALRNDPGLAHDRFNWRIKKGNRQDAIELILRQSALPDGLGQPAKWAGWRRHLARREMREGNARRAYALASSHHLKSGSSYSDLEWLSGYLALRYLNDPDLALDHFQRFRSAVETPISLGRAGYWIGRTQETLGDREAAQIAYRDGAQYQTSFYGLLAAEKAGIGLDPMLSGAGPKPSWRNAPFTQSELYQVGILALNAGHLSLAERFFVQLSTTLPDDDLPLLGQMAIDLGSPHLAVMIGKQAARRGITLPAPYYALHPLAKMNLPVPTEMSLAIARRESEFDPSVVSGAGAQGLMQLMPGTARDVARDLSLEHEPSRVRSDWRYNAQLGSTYLAQLGTRFDGNVVLVSAGYNAGPQRPINWMEQRGDPRRTNVDVVDWIEHIPFRETRNYVMRVAESLPIYRARLGKAALPIPFSAELRGSTVAPFTR